jgi:3-phosphoshikimate 1-carboxyvinyltransferase
VESDWSSASYYYSLAALGRGCINLKSFKPYSLQGDSVVKEIFWEFFGVNTISEGAEAKISLLAENNFKLPEKIVLDLNDTPDIAQTICVTAAALHIPFEITGLETLKIKETDRLQALKNELFKIGCIAGITEDSICSVKFFEPNDDIVIETYNDHRMAMSFAPFCLIKELTIENEQVVEKSYPDFWSDIKECLTQQND